MNSDGSAYWSAGKSTFQIINDICWRNGLGIQYRWGSITHEKTLYNGVKIGEMLTRTIEEAEKQLGKTSVMYLENNELVVDYKGSNQDVYVFKNIQNTMQTKDRLTMDNLVTQVIILGKEDKNGASSVEETINGELQYGTLTRVVKKSTDTKAADAQKEANQILKENGQPERQISPVECADVPFVRKGDKVFMSAGNLGGYFFVKSVTHDAATRKMTMELE
jgi:hypothetical protein